MTGSKNYKLELSLVCCLMLAACATDFKYQIAEDAPAAATVNGAGSGASIVNVRFTGDASTLPTASVARASNA